MLSTATGIENLTLNITEEIRVHASLDVTFGPSSNSWGQEVRPQTAPCR
jgi:hypothetical protein